MKKLLLLIVLFPSVGFCQGFLPRWELSLSTDLNSYSLNGQSESYASVAFRPGFYPVLGLGLSIEPELFVGAAKGEAPAINLSGNIAYSYGMGYWPVVPFAEVGFGMGDGIPFNQPLQREVGIVPSGIQFYNAGVGVKIMTLGGRALLRIEYRYQAFKPRTPPPYPLKIEANRILIGFGVLL